MKMLEGEWINSFLSIQVSLIFGGIISILMSVLR